ncbi:DUF1836 domain-containing protein [Streptococcus parauberis]|uniref:DUF1836 domain-containing protein n=1 Tax=Streptococcus parauberis TaxID=1348 RepID=A0A0E2UAC4_9STRE|nr:DUF1836 domain-containing protein [Streptococcus parauberis]AEF25215.1 hypothetical protein STP_0767 [Streptococcus parauberis KCTC 11537]EMF49890.1 hypothetical protein SPJ2_0710 [Streptococcus parauberis KRS-02109]KYP16987.1 hypothetical protein AKL14_02035 [Streptococcus parauberis]KYP18214.1 hypothetical protein AKL13_01659 [Streptococcus parauberis]KYP20423.1 hypothetical protein TN39_00785 [Streptococcus parauberis]
MTFPILPKWEQLPDLDLYLDQLLLYTNKTTNFGSPAIQKEVTASMINNYVKHGYLAKPIKKKYEKQQVARLIAVTILKNAFPIQAIAQVLSQLQEKSNSQVLYDTFVDYWNEEKTQDTPEIIINACQTIKYYFQTLQLVEITQEVPKNESNL